MLRRPHSRLQRLNLLQNKSLPLKVPPWRNSLRRHLPQRKRLKPLPPKLLLQHRPKPLLQKSLNLLRNRPL